jgi:hypothetical protein
VLVTTPVVAATPGAGGDNAAPQRSGRRHTEGFADAWPRNRWPRGTESPRGRPHGLPSAPSTPRSTGATPSALTLTPPCTPDHPLAGAPTQSTPRIARCAGRG